MMLAFCRDRINRLVNGITNEDNRNVSTAIQNRRMLQEQYGQAYQAGVGNVFASSIRLIEMLRV